MGKYSAGLARMNDQELLPGASHVAWLGGEYFGRDFADCNLLRLFG